MNVEIPTNPAQRAALHDQLSEQARLFNTMASAANDDDRRMALITAIQRLVLQCPFLDLNTALFALVDRIAKNIGRNGTAIIARRETP